MSITDELREVAQGYVPTVSHKILDIADRIDERVKNIRFNEHLKGYQDGIMDGCSHYDPEHTECMVSEEHGYIKLPVDADGVPIRVGDHVEETDMSKIGRAQGEVNRIVFGKHGTSVRIKTELGYADSIPQSLRHISKPPIVEDVLRDFAYCCEEGATEQSIDKTIAEYAEKLREVVEHERD